MVKLHAENIRLEGEILKANETIELLNKNVEIEHEGGFNKAVRQAAYLLRATPLSSGFDLGQDIYDGKIMPVPVSDDEEGPTEDVVEAGEADQHNDEGVGDDGGDENGR